MTDKDKGDKGEKPKKPSEKLVSSEKPPVLKPPLAPQRKSSFSKTTGPRGSLDGRSPSLSSAKASPATSSTLEGPAIPPISLSPRVSEVTEDKKKSKDDEEANKSAREEDEGDDEGDSTHEAEGEALELKHPLQHTWTLWFDLPAKDKSTAFSRQKTWSYTEALSFSTVEDFWRFYNNLLEPEKLKTGSIYCLFKQGILPGWEDPANSQGGRWMVELPRSGSECENLNNAFLMVILSMIGENFEPKNCSDDIVGVATSIRKDKWYFFLFLFLLFPPHFSSILLLFLPILPFPPMNFRNDSLVALKCGLARPRTTSCRLPLEGSSSASWTFPIVPRFHSNLTQTRLGRALLNSCLLSELIDFLDRSFWCCVRNHISVPKNNFSSCDPHLFFFFWSHVVFLVCFLCGNNAFHKGRSS